ncbi:MAG: histone deacetylase [Pseudomonadota bacterium]
MDVYYSDRFDLALPEKHRFPGQKYGMLRRKLIDDGIVDPSDLHTSPSIDRNDLLLAHSEAYVTDLETGTIDPSAMRRIGFPWSPSLAPRAKATCGGALAAARSALSGGISGQLAGGTHHAHRDFGSGYCMFNDFAVVSLTLLHNNEVSRIGIIDLDVHQGDGNASLLADNEHVFVLSVHGEKNFPFRKHPSDLDVGLPDETGDNAYLEAVESALEKVIDFKPDLILYQAGVDPLKEDRLGRLALTFNGLKTRDEMVLSLTKSVGIPVSMAIGGGYADPIEASVDAYAQTYRVARQIYD